MSLRLGFYGRRSDFCDASSLYGRVDKLFNDSPSKKIAFHYSDLNDATKVDYNTNTVYINIFFFIWVKASTTEVIRFGYCGIGCCRFG